MNDHEEHGNHEDHGPNGGKGGTKLLNNARPIRACGSNPRGVPKKSE
jgi:hypothetical protein